jgi:hypothetical protein
MKIFFEKYFDDFFLLKIQISLEGQGVRQIRMILTPRKIAGSQTVYRL